MFCGMLVVVPAVILGGFVENYFGYIVLRLLSCTCIVFSWIATTNFQVSNWILQGVTIGKATVFAMHIGFFLALNHYIFACVCFPA